MRRVFTTMIVLSLMLLMAVPAVATPPEEKFPQNFFHSMSASFRSEGIGSQQVSVSVGSTNEGMAGGPEFWVNVRICDYLFPTGSICWETAGEEPVVYELNFNKKGGFLEADIQMRYAWDWSVPFETIHMTMEATPTDLQTTRSNHVIHDEYGFRKITYISHSDEAPEVVLTFDDLLIEGMELPPLSDSSFGLNRSIAVGHES